MGKNVLFDQKIICVLGVCLAKSFSSPTPQRPLLYPVHTLTVNTKRIDSFYTKCKEKIFAYKPNDCKVQSWLLSRIESYVILHCLSASKVE